MKSKAWFPHDKTRNLNIQSIPHKPRVGENIAFCFSKESIDTRDRQATSGNKPACCPKMPTHVRIRTDPERCAYSQADGALPLIRESRILQRRSLSNRQWASQFDQSQRLESLPARFALYLGTCRQPVSRSSRPLALHKTKAVPHNPRQQPPQLEL